MTFKVIKDWKTKSGLRAVVLLVHGGSHHCGYVGVDKNHFLHGVDYGQEVEQLQDRIKEIESKSSDEHEINPIAMLCAMRDDGTIKTSPEIAFSVHGGLTFSGGDGEYPVRDKNLWWFGYDCAHSGDATGFLNCDGDTFKDENFCVDQCENLAQQLASVA